MSRVFSSFERRVNMLRHWLLVAVLSFSFGAQAAEKDFSSWRKFTAGELLSEARSAAPGATVTLGLHITLEGNWHTYWVNPGDSGAALRLDFKNGPGVKVKAVHMPTPQREKSGPLISFAYAQEVIFPIEVEVDKSAAVGSVVRIAVDAEWLICDEVCIPAIDSFILDLPITAPEDVRPSQYLGLLQKFLARVPGVAKKFPRYRSARDAAELNVETERGQKFVDFFPFRGAGVTNDRPDARVNAGGWVLTFKKSNVPRAGEDRVGVLIYSLGAGAAETLHAVQYGQPSWSFTDSGEARASGGSKSLWWMLISAFIGGLILNLMPCVFPILSIKLLSILKISKAAAPIIRRQNLGYVTGVMVSFLAIALALAGLRSAGHLVGWGFQLQSPAFLAFLCWLFLALALNLLGLFEIDFLNAGAGGRWTRLGGFWGSFFTGVLAVLVASPCTAPFMGVAVGFGISQPTPILIAVFFALGFGMAFPYAVMIVAPSLLKFLPKPGRWMERLKQVMAVPLILTVAWLLWVLQQISGGVAVAAVVAGGAILTLAVIFKAPRRVGTLATLAVLGGLMVWVHSRAQVPRLAAHGDWRPYTQATWPEFKGRNVFLNMTADWCLTCKVNESLIFSDAEVVALLHAKNVEMVMGDWTQRNAEISRFLSGYGRVGVPFYVFFSPRNPDGRVLPEVMTKSSFIEQIHSEFP